MSEIWSTAETAARISDPPLPVATLRYWRHVGEGPKSFKIGRRVVYRRADVEAWLASQYETTVRGGAL